MGFFRGLSASLSLFILSLFAILTLNLHGPARGQEMQPLCNDKLICLDQGWTEDDRRWWYTTSQGSRLLPLSWMLALEGPDSISPAERFLSENNVARWGYLANPASEENPDGLPVGFAVDRDESFNDDGPVANIMCDTFPAHCRSSLMQKPWIGLTCAACHTNDIKFGGKTFRVEGASASADFQTFNEDLFRALKNTLEQPGRFQRFATGVLGSNPSQAQRDGLKQQLAEQVAWKKKLEDMNKGDVRYGHGRIDAQGHILNRVALTTRPGGPINRVRPNAPASTPFIWNTHQQNKLQWNGIAKLEADGLDGLDIFGIAKKAGALIRNTSEVIGVFAHVESHDRVATQGYKSSVRVEELGELEKLLSRLESPRWPEDILGPIDHVRASRGEAQFKPKCGECHSHLDSDNLKSDIEVVMTPIQEIDTDLSLACNTFFHKSRTRKFQGQKVFVFKGPRIKPEDVTSNMLTNLAIGVVLRKILKAGPDLFDDVAVSLGGGEPTAPPGEALPGVSDKTKKDFAEKCLSTKHPLLAYKARPLNGVWATAPYLHNGSVPTLYDLLLPAKVRQTRRIGIPDQPAGSEFRPESFGVGSPQFDPKNVGFVTDPAANPTIFHTRDPNSGEPIPGNLNSGHDYGTDLTEDQRRDLVEYLKTL